MSATRFQRARRLHSQRPGRAASHSETRRTSTATRVASVRRPARACGRLVRHSEHGTQRRRLRSCAQRALARSAILRAASTTSTFPPAAAVCGILQALGGSSRAQQRQRGKAIRAGPPPHLVQQRRPVMFAELLDEILVSFTLEWGQYVTMACLDIAIAAACGTALATHSVSGLGMLSGIALAVVAGVQGLTNHTL